MKRCLLILCALLLGGCSAAGQIEGQAFVVTLAADRAAEGGLTLAARYPDYGAQGEKEKSGYLVTAASGPDFASALYALNAAVPRALNLTQVKCLIVSEELAASADFFPLLTEFKLSRLDGAASLIVCRGEARALLSAQQPLIGLRLSDTLATEIERYQRLGSIPESALAQVFLSAASVYSDPVAIYAALTPEETALSDAAPADEAGAGALIYAGENDDQYFGAALFRGGVMVGRLGGGETQLLRLIRDGAARMPMALDGVWLTVSRRGRPRVSMDAEARHIEVELTVGVEDLTDGADEEAVARALAAGLDRLTRRCQALGTEPFGYAVRAAARCLTMDEWRAFGWRERFAAAEVVYDVRVEKTNR